MTNTLPILKKLLIEMILRLNILLIDKEHVGYVKKFLIVVFYLYLDTLLNFLSHLKFSKTFNLYNVCIDNLIIWRIGSKRRKAYTKGIEKDFMTLACYTLRWWNCRIFEDEKTRNRKVVN